MRSTSQDGRHKNGGRNKGRGHRPDREQRKRRECAMTTARRAPAENVSDQGGGRSLGDPGLQPPGVQPPRPGLRSIVCRRGRTLAIGTPQRLTMPSANVAYSIVDDAFPIAVCSKAAVIVHEILCTYCIRRVSSSNETGPAHSSYKSRVQTHSLEAHVCVKQACSKRYIRKDLSE